MTFSEKIVLSRYKGFKISSHTWSDFRLLKFVVLNTVVQNGSLVFRQKIGIPMGTNAAPLLANICLYSFERDFIESLPPESPLISSFHNAFRFIDDLLVVDPHDDLITLLTNSPEGWWACDLSGLAPFGKHYCRPWSMQLLRYSYLCSKEKVVPFNIWQKQGLSFGSLPISSFLFNYT